MLDTPIAGTSFSEVSPDRKWIVFQEPSTSEGSTLRIAAHAADGSRSVALCDFCSVRWSPDSKTMYFNFPFGMGRNTETIAIPNVLAPGAPALPPNGLSLEQAVKFPGAKRLDRIITPSAVSGVFAYEKFIVQRNIYRIPLQ